ncbi:GNAT family N-acetyltransferase [Staphylothermus hellenicus]|uniref:GCN5-related N-acetyltransferase n=1 Tax=Staphylothermus hellenicus (strain DSM 12710 / JCM 10830 / BK20S6-10-b1 / P8) TaxID=591019 RepID=D7D9V7_STAHD|nr:GNAT family N-acetyltransferase [Staphylothermus hellenicus]ADI32553.1 GCN5-related N-acetyltransferase [Staphylothermus hellenicus DSM 12710]
MDLSEDVAVKIRFPRSSEAYDIFKIHLDSLSGLDEEDYEWFYNLLKVKSSGRIVLVADYHGKVVGFLIAYRRHNKIYIDSLAVDPKHRGLGIGSKLLRELEERLRGKKKKTIYLSVKKDNYSALGFYLKNDYVIDGVVLELSQQVSKVTKITIPNYSFILKNAKDAVINAHMLPTTWWSNITEPVDKLVYHRITDEKILIVYEDGKLRGVAEFQPDKKILVDYLAVSYHKPIEALLAIISKLGDIAYSLGAEQISVNIDSSKNKMIRAFLQNGFRITGSEYRLKKQLQH